MKLRVGVIKKLKRKLFYGISRKLLLLVGGAGVLLIVLLSTVIGLVSGKYLEETSIRLLDNQTRQTVSHFDSQMETLKNTAMTISRQRSVQSVIEGKVQGYDAFVAYRDAYDTLKSTHDYNENLDSYLFSVKDAYLMSSQKENVTSDYAVYGVESKDWYREVIASDKSLNTVSNFIPPISGGEEQFAVILTLRDMYDWSVQGLIVVSLPKSILFHGTAENYRMAVLDQNGGAAFQSADFEAMVDRESLQTASRELRQKGSLYGSGYRNLYVFGLTSAFTDWQFISFFSTEEAQLEIYTLQLTAILASAVCIALLLLCTAVISRYLVAPVNRLTTAIHKVEGGDFAQRIEVKGIDEVGELVESFNRLVAAIIDNKLLLRRAEIDVLQKQINPHFLFNTLESVRVLSISGESRRSAEMIEKLADFFRYNINREGVPVTTVEEELTHVRNYIDIQLVRFSERLTVSYDLDPKIMDCTTLKFILQPVVENAIIHCTESMASTCRLALSARLSDGNVVLAVRDNGPGIEGERLNEIRKFVYDTGGETENPGVGIGLRNIQDRLRLFYGEGFGITIESDGAHFTEITLRIPAV